MIEGAGAALFVRGVLSVPINGTDNVFGWGLWVRVAPGDFKRVLDSWNLDASHEPPFDAVLAAEIPGYDGLDGEPVSVRLGTQKERPRFTMKPESTHKIAAEQRSGITIARAHEIVRMVLPSKFH